MTVKLLNILIYLLGNTCLQLGINLKKLEVYIRCKDPIITLRKLHKLFLQFVLQ